MKTSENLIQINNLSFCCEYLHVVTNVKLNGIYSAHSFYPVDHMHYIISAQNLATLIEPLVATMLSCETCYAIVVKEFPKSEKVLAKCTSGCANLTGNTYSTSLAPFMYPKAHKQWLIHNIRVITTRIDRTELVMPWVHRTLWGRGIAVTSTDPYNQLWQL